jgi:CDGSH-type Zn-finger protein
MTARMPEVGHTFGRRLDLVFAQKLLMEREAKPVAGASGACWHSAGWNWRKGRIMADVVIKVSNNGPYVVSGVVEVRDADGGVYTVKQSFALCRCGGSSNKPFCDGTHKKIEFQAGERARS